MVIVTAAALVSVLVSSAFGPSGRGNASPAVPSVVTYPSGTPAPSAPSREGPPGARSMPGFRLRYATTFEGTELPSGWQSFAGTPGGIPDGQFGATHAVVTDGVLRLEASRDPAYGNRWVTGGVCLCDLSQTYGAYFVRSRLTGPGPDEVQLLWPATNAWPPEIDFYESGGGTTGSVATVHYGANNGVEQHTISINLTKWHTFGVVWRSDSLTYTVDGNVWASVTLPWEIPKEAMTLHLQQEASCTLGLSYWCPHQPVSMEVAWVAVYELGGIRRTSSGHRP